MQQLQALHSAHEVVDALGGIKRVASLTGRTRNAAGNWRRFGAFPSNTYVAMIGELGKAGFTASPALWEMSPPHPEMEAIERRPRPRRKASGEATA